MGIAYFIVAVLMLVALIFDLEIITWCLLGAYAVWVIVTIIRCVIYSKKTYVCAYCGEEFKLKWRYLYQNYYMWGVCGQEVVELDNESHKTVWVHCRKCGSLKAWYK